MLNQQQQQQRTTLVDTSGVVGDADAVAFNQSNIYPPSHGPHTYS